MLFILRHFTEKAYLKAISRYELLTCILWTRKYFVFYYCLNSRPYTVFLIVLGLERSCYELLGSEVGCAYYAGDSPTQYVNPTLPLKACSSSTLTLVVIKIHSS